jgi:hypothetical protein
MSLPDYNFLPAPLWLITILHVVTLTLHLTAMNFLFGSLIVVVFGRIDDKWRDPTVKTFVRLLPTAMAATVTLGVAPLLFLQLVYYQQAYAAAIVSAWPWLMIVVAVIFAYYFLYGASFAAEGETGRVPAWACAGVSRAGFRPARVRIVRLQHRLFDGRASRLVPDAVCRRPVGAGVEQRRRLVVASLGTR